MSATLCEKIAGTVNHSDFARMEKTYSDRAVQHFLPQSQACMAALTKIASKPIVSPEERAAVVEKIASRTGFDVVQIRPTRYGYMLKVSAAPEGVKPKEKEVSSAQAKQTLPKEALETADQQGVATMTEVEAEPDPLEEQPKPVEGFGMYKVWEAGTGRQFVGYCIPGLFDPMAGGPSQMMLFTNGSAYSLAPDAQGVLVNVSYNVPDSGPIPRGLGVFFKTSGKGILATVPYEVITSVTVEGREIYSARTVEGAEVQLVRSEGLQKPLQTGPTEIAIPADYQFLALDNEVQLQGMGGDPMAQEKQAAADTMIEIRAWRNEGGHGGGCDLRGPALEKVGAGTYDWVDGLFWMAATGIPQNMGVACLEKAASSGEPVRLYNVRPLNPHRTELKEAMASAMAGAAGMHLPERVDLLREALYMDMSKEARAIVGPNSVDNLLALNFINPENVQDFVDHLPHLEETQSKLASLQLAVQLGLESVPDAAVSRAMGALENVISGLKGLQTHPV